MQNDDLLANVTEVAGSKVLPPCVVMNRLGRGGMGAVYRARHLNLAIDVAVKVLKPQLVADDPQFVQRFKREGQSAAAISHQNVIRVFDVAEHGGLHYIIMELVVGENARDRVQRKGPLPVGEALQILHDAAQGLGAAHALGIVHRDVKPDNLLISTMGQLKVADLGLAKPTLGGGNASLMSAANQVMGTPSYMPPEQWESPAVTAAADVWALGATLWFLLVGEEAFDSRDGNFPRVMKQIVLLPFPDLKRRRPDVPDAVLAVFAKATAKEPKDRYADAGELAAALEALDLPRVSLRDRTQTTEAQTMVSPSPKNLDQIKQWLREDNLTRLQTPKSQAAAAAAITAAGAGGAASAAGAGGGAAGGGGDRGSDSATMPSGARPEVGGKSPSTVSGYEPPQVRRSRRGVWAAVAVLAVGGAIAGYMMSQPDTDPQRVPIGKVDPDAGKDAPKVPVSAPPPEVAPKPEPEKPQPEVSPFAEVDSLAAAEKFGAALAAYETVVAANAKLADDQRLARLLAPAREAVDLAVMFPPLVAIPRPTTLGFVATVNANRITKLIVNGVEATARSASEYIVSLPGPPEELLIRAQLVEGPVVEFPKRRVEYRERPKLTFPVAITTSGVKRIGDIDYTTYAELRISGQASERDAEITCNDVPLKVTFQKDGSFNARIPLGRDGELTTVRIRARKQGFDDSGETVLRAVALREKPTIRIEAEKTTDRMKAPVVVTTSAEYGIVAVTCGVGDGRLPFRRNPDRRDQWVGEVQLAPDENTINAVATTFNDLDALASFRVKCTIEAPLVTDVVLRVGGADRRLARDVRPVYVKAGELTLRAKATGTRTRLKLGDTEITSEAETPIDLADGARATFTFTAGNDMPRPDAWTVTIVRDATKPDVKLTGVATNVPADKPLTLSGTWADVGGLDEVRVDDVRAAMPADATAGTWSVTLPPPNASRTCTLVARDRAGNEFTLPIPITVKAAVVPQPQAQPKPEPPKGNPNPGAAKALLFDGFTSDGTDVNELGYPKKIVDTATGIELIAVPFAADKKPTLYVARTPVTEKQFDPAGAGTDAARTNITATEVAKWLEVRPRFRLLTVEEWKGLGANPDLDLRSSIVEWLRPSRPTDSSWPVIKDAGRETYARGTSLSSLGFRVVFRVP
jgi:hypothetical protein